MRNCVSVIFGSFREGQEGEKAHCQANNNITLVGNGSSVSILYWLKVRSYRNRWRGVEWLANSYFADFKNPKTVVLLTIKTNYDISIRDVVFVSVAGGSGTFLWSRTGRGNKKYDCRQPAELSTGDNFEIGVSLIYLYALPSSF